MKARTPTRGSADAGASSPIALPPRRMSEGNWDDKWHSMVDHQRLRRQQDAQLRQKLLEKQEIEEFIECTFTPKTRCNYKSRDAEELLQLMKPLISEEERILQELKTLDAEEEKNVQTLSRDLRSHIMAPQQGDDGEALIRLCEHYREERLKELSRVKNRKLDIVGLLHEVERKYNVICVKEHITDAEAARAGFSLDSCRSIKKEIIDSVKAVDTLKDRARVTTEIESIIKKAKEDAERLRLQHQARMAQGWMPGAHGPGMRMHPQFMGQRLPNQMPYPMVHAPGMRPGFVPMPGVAPNGMMARPMPQQMRPGAQSQAGMPAGAVPQAAPMRAPAGMVLPPGFAPGNPQIGFAAAQRPNGLAAMFQRNRPRKLQQ